MAAAITYNFAIPKPLILPLIDTRNLKVFSSVHRRAVREHPRRNNLFGHVVRSYVMGQ